SVFFRASAATRRHELAQCGIGRLLAGLEVQQAREVALEGRIVARVDFEAGQHAAERRAVVAVVEEADVPARAEGFEEMQQGAGTLGELEAEQALAPQARRGAADQVPDMQARN